MKGFFGAWRETDRSALMEKEFKIIYQGGSSEIEEKKSRFIADIRPVSTQEEALEFIESIRKKYWDARHHCYAYVLGEKDEIARCSDDGEPAQTAGRPMLDVLYGAGVHNVIAVVTRYFGGTLLGTGGLVRAYSRAVAAGLENCRILTRQTCEKIRVTSDYPALGKIQYIAGNMEVPCLDSVYTDSVETTWLVREDQKAFFIKKLTEATSGQADIVSQGQCFAALSGRDVILL